MLMPPRNNRKEIFSPEWPTQLPESPPPSPNHSHGIVSFSSSSSAADNFFSTPSIEPFVVPLGYRFAPTDEELIFYYLKPFLRNKKSSSPYAQIHRANIYESNPEQLSKEYEKGNDKEWFFITERTKVHEGGKNQKRCDNNGGYWHRRGATKKINAGEGVVGYKTTLSYLVGKPPEGVKTEWLMQEYWIQSSGHDKTNDVNKVDHALCKIYLSPRKNKRKVEEEEEEERKRSRSCNNNTGCEEEEEEERKRSRSCNNNNECEKTLDVAIQQPYQPQAQEQQQQLHFLPLISDDELYEMINSHEILDDDGVDDFLAGYIENPTGWI